MSDPSTYIKQPSLTDAVSEPERINGIDVARGIALLGIFLVNMQLFAEPFGRMVGIPGPPEGSGPLDAAAYYFMFIFCGGKFYPLFSTLFGIGFMIQLTRAERSGRKFVPAYLRRLGFLCILGLMHALLLWYGDILFIYSIAGLLLFGTVMVFRRENVAPGGFPVETSPTQPLPSLATGESAPAGSLPVGGGAQTTPFGVENAPRYRNISGRALLITGITLVIVSTLIATGLNLLMSLAEGASTEARQVQEADSATQPATAPTTEPAELPVAASPAKSPSDRLFAGFRAGTVKKGPADPIWLKAETEAYRDGPWIETLIFRSMTWLFMMLFTLIGGFGLHVLGMFFIGAGLYRSGVFSADRLAVHRKLVLLGLFVGLPIVLAGVLLPRLTDDDRWYMILGLTNMLGGPMMSLAYLGGAVLIAASGVAAPAVAAVARVGRMALTNYLTETVVATFLMYHWGLGWFGSVLPAKQFLIVFVVYGGLLITSTIWLRFFQFGPMEWLWRTVTYLRPQPLVRREDAGRRP